MLWLAIGVPARADERLDALLDAGLVYAGYLDADSAGDAEARTHAFIQLLVDNQQELVTPQTDLQAVLNSALVRDAAGGVVTLPRALELVRLGLGMVPPRFEDDLSSGDARRIALAQGYLQLLGHDVPVNGVLEERTVAEASKRLKSAQNLPEGLVDDAGNVDFDRVILLADHGQLPIPESHMAHYYMARDAVETMKVLPVAAEKQPTDIFSREAFAVLSMLQPEDGTAPTYRRFLANLMRQTLDKRIGTITQAAAHNRPVSLSNCLAAIEHPVLDNSNQSILKTCDYSRLKRENPTDEQVLAVIDYFGSAFPVAVSHETIVAWATPLAERGNAAALHHLGSTYLAFDKERAAALYSLAAQRGDMDAERSLYLFLKNNPDDFVNATERAAQLLEQAAALEHTWALDLIATQNRRAEERQAAASRAAGEKAMADLLGLILAAAATAIANGEVAPSESQDGFEPDPCASSRDIFGWSGGDPDVAAAIALGGCAPY